VGATTALAGCRRDWFLTLDAVILTSQKLDLALFPDYSDKLLAKEAEVASLNILL
jgi:hypothetical protein